MSTVEELWPGDTRPVHPLYGAPINPDGSVDLSRGMANDHSVTESQRMLLEAWNKLEDSAKSAHLIEQAETALQILGVALPLLSGFVPPVAPFVSPVLLGLGAALNAAKK